MQQFHGHFFYFDKTVLFTLNYSQQFWDPSCLSPLWFWITENCFFQITIWLSHDLEPSNGAEIFPEGIRKDIMYKCNFSAWRQIYNCNINWLYLCLHAMRCKALLKCVLSRLYPTLSISVCIWISIWSFLFVLALLQEM